MEAMHGQLRKQASRQQARLTWREERIAELEKRIEAMRSQVKERASSEDKYVEAAMTLAKLHAQGISAEPPKLNGSNSGGIAQDTYPSELHQQRLIAYLGVVSSGR